ncbi:MAG: PIG-L family deacetylase [Salinibacterium sp.]|nr:PIG-L family deacetylase [Salinibacterium sp.]
MSFDHQDAGTAESDWLASPRWQSVPHLTVAAARSVVIVAAHPDDETLGAGGLVARLHALGAVITVILATRGERAFKRDISAERLTEFQIAVERLAPRARIVDLELPDAALGMCTAELRTAVTDAAVGAELIIAPWRGDGHGDHCAAGEAASSAAAETGARLLEYPIWLWHWAKPNDATVPWDRFLRLPLDPATCQAKGDGLAAYASQTSGVDGEAPIIHSGMLAHFTRSWETFVDTAR